MRHRCKYIRGNHPTAPHDLNPCIAPKSCPVSGAVLKTASLQIINPYRNSVQRSLATRSRTTDYVLPVAASRRRIPRFNSPAFCPCARPLCRLVQDAAPGETSSPIPEIHDRSAHRFWVLSERHRWHGSNRRKDVGNRPSTPMHVG